MLDRGRGNPRYERGLQQRYDAQDEVLRAADADVWLLQELGSETTLYELADVCGMTCELPPAAGDMAGVCALARAASGFHVGIMWRPGRVAPDPDTWRAFGDRYRLHHALATVVLRIDG